jgi:YD repeat-containing protein
MKKFLLFCLLISMSTHSIVLGQDISLQNMIPPSPEATAFAKAATYNVGPYTGRPDITVPIYTIKTPSLSVPISLSYDATGIRVNDMASWVGQNWSLNAGGMISQVVIGQPDINTSTGLEAVPPRASDVVNNATYFNYLQSLVDGDIAAPKNPDADPDKFFYSFNGKSGSFVLDRNRNIMQIPKTSVKIFITTSLSSTSPQFTIIDENGTTYLFSDIESTESYNYSYQGTSPAASSSGSIYRKQNTAYYLTQITSQGGEQIHFSYESGITATRDDMYADRYGDVNYLQGSPGPTQHVHLYRWNGVQRVTTIPRLTTISFPNGKVVFSRVADRQDDAGLTSASRLDEITVYQKNQKDGTSYIKLRSFKFVQGYYYSADTYGQYSGIGNQTVDRYRLRLDELDIKDATGLQMSRYQFKYNSTSPPPKTACSQDWWGYYNGHAENMTLVPTTSIPDGNGGTTTVGGANRSCNETYMKAGILEKIVYPTGGYTNFETEAHQLLELYSNLTPSTSAVGLGNISSKNTDAQTFTTSSSFVTGTGTLNITISPYSATDPMPFVKIKNMSTGQEQTFTAPGNSSGNSSWYSTVISYNFSANTTYQLTASCFVIQPNSTAAITAAYTATVYSPHTTPVGGLRIKSIKNYNSDNTLASEENYRYGENENGGGVFVGIQGNAFTYAKSQKFCYPGGDVECEIRVYPQDYTIFSGGALFDQALIQGSPVVYTDVTKYYGSPTSNAGKTMYNYGTADQQVVETKPLPAGQYLANNQGILIINNTWKKGQLVYQRDYRRNADGSFSLVQENQNTYNVVYTDTTYGFIAQAIYDKIFTCSWCARYFEDYNYAEYPVYSGYVQLAQNVKNLYSQDGNGYTGTTTNYTYDPAHPDFKTTESFTNSKGELVQTIERYPFNKTDLLATGPLTTAQSTAIDNMVLKNMISPVLEETRSKNGTQVSRKRTPYEFVNGNTIAPVNVQWQVGTNPIETRLFYTQYDALGNLLAQQKTNDESEAYIWDYQSQYVVAAVKNAVQADVAYTSFEADGAGNWTLGSTSRDVNSGFTGGISYVLTNLANDIQRTGLTATMTYIVSYWTTNASAFNIAGTLSGYPVKGKTVTVNGVQWTYYEHKVSGQSTISITGAGHIDELRLYPANAQMQSFTYSPLIGLTSQDDVAGRITYYEYDGLGRLLDVRDQDGNVIKTLEYHFYQP